MELSDDNFPSSLLTALERQTSLLNRMMVVMMKANKIEAENTESSNGGASTSTLSEGEKAIDNNNTPADKSHLRGQIFSDPLGPDNLTEASENAHIAAFFRQLGSAQKPIQSSSSLINQYAIDEMEPIREQLNLAQQLQNLTPTIISSDQGNKTNLIVSLMRAIDAENFLATNFENELQALISSFKAKMNSSFSFSYGPIESSLETFSREADRLQVNAISELMKTCLSELALPGCDTSLEPPDSGTFTKAADCFLALTALLNAFKGAPSSFSKLRPAATECFVGFFTCQVNTKISYTISKLLKSIAGIPDWRTFAQDNKKGRISSSMTYLVASALALLRRLLSPDYIVGLGEKVCDSAVYSLLACFASFWALKERPDEESKPTELIQLLDDFGAQTFFWEKEEEGGDPEREKTYFGKTVRVTVTLSALLSLLNRQRPSSPANISSSGSINLTARLVEDLCTKVDTLLEKMEQHQMLPLPLDSTLEGLLLQLHIAFENITGKWFCALLARW